MKVFKLTIMKIFIFWITLGVFFVLLILTGCRKEEKKNTDSDGLSVTQEVCNDYEIKM